VARAKRRAKRPGETPVTSLAGHHVAGRRRNPDPGSTHRPKKLKKPPVPFVHAATKAIREERWEAYATFVAAYRDAAEKLRAGDPDPPHFPAGCFPPALPFVSA
jgi:hypothetical protein